MGSPIRDTLQGRGRVQREAKAERPQRHKLSIPLPFFEALKAAMKLPADMRAKSHGKKRRASAKKG